MLAETLAAVVDEGTFDAAAARLRLTPSAVSQRVKSLEEQIGRVLVVRSKPARATDAGAAVVRYARELALLEREALRGLGAEGTDAVRIPIAANADSFATWFLPPLVRLSNELGVRFDLYRDDQDYTTERLASGDVSAVVTSSPFPVAGCSVRPLGRMPYFAVAARGFADRWFPEGPTRETLERAPFVDFDRRDRLQRDWLEARGVDPTRPPWSSVPAAFDFVRAVELGLGWALAPELQARDALADGVLVRLDETPVHVPLFWQQWNIASPTLDRVAAEVAAEARRALDPA